MSDENLAPTKVDTDQHDLSNVSFTANIGLISDLHAKGDQVTKIVDHVEEIVEEFETRSIDTAVILGDVIEESENKSRDKQVLSEVVKPLKEAKFETIFVLGNHDVVSLTTTEFLDIVDQDSSYGTFDVNESIKGIFLDSSSPKFEDARGSVPEKQIEFLKHEASNTQKRCLVFVHHPVHYHDIPDDSWFAEHPECAFAHNKYLIEEIVRNHENIACTVNGHSHIGNIETEGGVTNITASAMNKYRPSHDSLTGYYSVMEVSECRLKYEELSVIDFSNSTHHQNNTVDKSKVAFGGTFDPIHDGHKQLFESALEIGDVTVGLTSDSLAPKTRHEERYILPYKEREAALENVLDSISRHTESRYSIKKLENPEGVVTEDKTVTHLVVSPETLGRGIEINSTRIEKGFDPLQIEVIEPALAEDGEVLSSTRICKGEIDVHGNLTPSANGREPIN